MHQVEVQYRPLKVSVSARISTAKAPVQNHSQPHLHDWLSVFLLNLPPALWSRITAFDSLHLWPLDVVRWYPLFVVTLGARRNRRSIGPQCGSGFARVDFSSATGPLLGLVPAPRALLRKVGSYPDVVEEIQDPSGAGEQEDVEEYA